ncbi:MAG TPA: lactate utilization protein [bacterium]|nr:lactate utilization protein [bacterium]
MDYLELEYWSKKIPVVIQSLTKNRFNVYICENSKEAKTKIFSLIPETSKIGIGGSKTLEELNIIEDLKNKNYTIINPPNITADYSEILEQRRLALLADAYLCSTNAITTDGFLVNIDGLSNRVAALLFGPKKVIIVAGINKITEDIDSALQKIKSYTAPMNAMRLKRTTPCASVGVCANCNNDDRICSNIVISGFQKDKKRIHIILIKENLGI